MSCGTPREIQYRSGVFSDGTTTNVFIPVSAAFRIDEVAAVGLAFEVQCRTANLTLQAAIQYSDDGVSWDSPVVIGAAVTSTGWAYRGLESSNAARQFGRIGFLAKSSSGSQPEKGQVALTVRFRS